MSVISKPQQLGRLRPLGLSIHKKNWTLDKAEKRKNEMERAIQREMWGSGKMNRGLWRGILQETDHLEGVGTDRRIRLKWVL